MRRTTTTTYGTRATQDDYAWYTCSLRGTSHGARAQGQQEEGLRIVSVNSPDPTATWKHGQRLAVFGDVHLQSSRVAPSMNLNFIFENQKADFSFLNKRNNYF